MNIQKKLPNSQHNTAIKVKLIISKKVSDQIKYLCKLIPAHEWSGNLFYEVEGSIKDIPNMVLKAVDILPLDKGTATYTSTTTDSRFIDFIMQRPDLEECKIGLIHSHNSMGVFFSGTDNKELLENAFGHNYYLSLIINNKHEMCARLAHVVNKEVRGNMTVSYFDDNGEKYEDIRDLSTESKEVVEYYDCEITPEIEEVQLDDLFKANVDKIIEESKKSFYTSSYGKVVNNSIYNKNNSGKTIYDHYDDFYNYDYYDNDWNAINKTYGSQVKSKYAYDESTGITYNTKSIIDLDFHDPGELEIEVELFLIYLFSNGYGAFKGNSIEATLNILLYNLQLPAEEIIKDVKEDFNESYGNYFKEEYDDYLDVNAKNIIINCCIELLEIEKEMSENKNVRKVIYDLMKYLNGLMTNIKSESKTNSKVKSKTKK